MRVLLAMDRLGYDESHYHGAGRLMVEWTRALVEQGVDVTSVILRPGGSLGDHALAQGLPFVFLDRGRYDPRTLWDMLDLMRSRRIQVAHLQGFGSLTFGRLAARRLGIPVIAHIHADHRVETMGYPWFVRALDHLLAPGTASVLAVSEFARDFAVTQQGFPEDRVEVVYNPVDVKRFRPPTDQERQASRRALGLAPSDRVVACLTRFHPVKGIDVLLDAWPEVAGRVGGARLLLIGEGPLREELEAQAAETCPAGSVRFLGYRVDVQETLAAADAAVLPSRAEGFSVAALEVLACGLPLVATRVGGNDRVVGNGRSGLLVDPEDPPALAAGLIEILSDDGLRERLARGAAESVREYDLRAFARRLVERYARLAGRGSDGDSPPGHP